MWGCAERASRLWGRTVWARFRPAHGCELRVGIVTLPQVGHGEEMTLSDLGRTRTPRAGTPLRPPAALRSERGNLSEC